MALGGPNPTPLDKLAAVRHTGVVRNRRAGLLFVAVVLSGACESPPIARWGVSADLEPLPSTRVDKPAATCAAGGEIRTARGCPGRRRLAAATAPTVEDGTGRASFTIPTALIGSSLILDRRWRPDGLSGWRHLPPLRIHRAESEETLDFPGIAQTSESTPEMRAHVWEIGPAEQTTVSAPFLIPEGSILTGGYAIHEAAHATGGSSVRFTVTLLVPEEGGTEESRFLLVDETLDGDSSDRWHDYRIALADWAGARASLLLRSEVLAEGRGSGVSPFSLPLWSTPQLLEPGGPRPNVLLVSLDTLRADALGAYGSAVGASPQLDRFADSAVVFNRAYTTFPTTTASHMSLFTGLYPAVHEVVAPFSGQLSPAIQTLAEALANAGYRTGAITENGMVARGSGFGRGFQTYREIVGDPNVLTVTPGESEQVVDLALSWLDERPHDAFFLFVHTYEVHAPYEPSPDDDIFEETWSESPTGRLAMWRDARNLYMGEVRYLDRQMGRLLEGLRQRGLDDSTIVVVSSDHGEQFGEHGGMSHGGGVFTEVAHVPLLLRLPDAKGAGRRIDSAVSLVDVAPTLLDLLGLPPLPHAQGRSLTPLLPEQEPPTAYTRVIFTENDTPRGVLAIQEGPDKWILGYERGPLMYDRNSDPGERRPLEGDVRRARGEELAARFRDHAETLRTRLEAQVVGEATAREATDQSKARDAADDERDLARERRLRALGYLE